jgi:hypothetical protein
VRDIWCYSPADRQALAELKLGDKVVVHSSAYGQPQIRLAVVEKTTAARVTVETNDVYHRDSGRRMPKSTYGNIYPVTAERQQAVEESRQEYEEKRERQKLILHIHGARLEGLTIETLRELDVILTRSELA